MAPSLHVRARDALPDAAALTYTGLRLPPCMPSVRLVLLGASLDNMTTRGVANIGSLGAPELAGPAAAPVL